MSFIEDYNAQLYHHGVKGQKWGVRRYQNKDGSLTPAGKKRYKSDDLDKKLGEAKNNREVQKVSRKLEKQYNKDFKKAAKAGDEEAFNRISAGRTLLKMAMDSGYMNQALTDAAIQANVEVGKDFAYDIKRNDKTGTVDITIDKVTSSYAYLKR